MKKVLGMILCAALLIWTPITSHAEAAKWYDGFQRGVWYDAGDHFFYICEIDSYEANKDLCFSPEIDTYRKLLVNRYPGLNSNPRFLNAKQAGGVPVVIADIADFSTGVLDVRSSFLWTKGCTRDRSSVKVDQTFAPVGMDSPWGQFYVIHGDGLDAYYYAPAWKDHVDTDKEYLLYDATNSRMWNRAHEIYGYKDLGKAINLTTVGTWNGKAVYKVYFCDWQNPFSSIANLS